MRPSRARHLVAFCALAGVAAAGGPAGAGAQKPTVTFQVVTNEHSGEFVFATPPTGRLRLSARYLDGHVVPSGRFHIDDMPTMSLEAVEIFRGPSEVPASMHKAETAYGVISIWSREPPPKEKPDSVSGPQTHA